MRDWLEGYLAYTEPTEPPLAFHFWVGVSAIAAALQRRVWLDMEYFQWVPNFYIILVAPPGLVKKSSTIGIASQMLREVSGIHFGAANITWQALVESLRQAQEGFEYQGEVLTQSALHIEASELGTFFNPNDRELVDFLTHIWDGQKGVFEKRTKTQGAEKVVNPCVNIIGATTPSWLEQHLSEHFIQGGMASRCIFVYKRKPRRLIAYPKRGVLPELQKLREALVEDLQHIGTLVGEIELSRDAMEWGEQWYARHFERNQALLDTAIGGYLARKQTHMHKLAMVLSVAQSDDLVITQEHLQRAEQILTSIEPTMFSIYDRVGRTDTGRWLYEIVRIVEEHGRIKYSELYRYMMKYVDSSTFMELLTSCVKARMVKIIQQAGEDDYLVVALHSGGARQGDEKE